MAFPTTSVLDDFNRGNVNPPSANWDYHINSGFSGRPTLAVISNQCGLDTPNFGSGYWDASTFGPDTEIYVTLAVLPGTNVDTFLDVRIQGPGTGGSAPSTADGYSVAFVNKATDELQFNRVDNAVYTQLGPTQTPGNLVAGDKIGVEMIGFTIKAYRHDGASWAQYGTSETDSTYSSAGYIGGGFGDEIGRWEDFGGGTVVAGGGRTTKNTRGFGHGMEVGMNWRGTL